MKNGIAKQANIFVEKSFESHGQWLAAVGYSMSYSSNLANRNWPLQSMQNTPAATLSSWMAQYVAGNGATNPANVQVQNPWQPATGALLPFTGTMAGRTIPQYITMLPYPLLYGSGAGVDESPFGKNKRLAIANRVGRALAGDWNIGTVITAQSGMPFDVPERWWPGPTEFRAFP